VKATPTHRCRWRDVAAAVERCQTREIAHVALRNSLEPPNSGLDTSTNRCCPEFRDHVNFDARAEWDLRHTDGTAGMDATLAEHLDK